MFGTTCKRAINEAKKFAKTNEITYWYLHFPNTDDDFINLANIIVAKDPIILVIHEDSEKGIQESISKNLLPPICLVKDGGKEGDTCTDLEKMLAEIKEIDSVAA